MPNLGGDPAKQKMYYQSRVKERRAILTLADLIGKNELPNVAKSEYFSAQNLHVYSLILEPVYKKTYFVTVWTKPKTNPGSDCLFADNVNLLALENMKDFNDRLSNLIHTH